MILFDSDLDSKDSDPLTLEEVGDKIGVTRERVRQLQEHALRELRKSMAKLEKQRTAEEIKHEDDSRKSQNTARNTEEDILLRTKFLREALPKILLS